MGRQQQAVFMDRRDGATQGGCVDGQRKEKLPGTTPRALGSFESGEEELAEGLRFPGQRRPGESWSKLASFRFGPEFAALPSCLAAVFRRAPGSTALFFRGLGSTSQVRIAVGTPDINLTCALWCSPPPPGLLGPGAGISTLPSVRISRSHLATVSASVMLSQPYKLPVGSAAPIRLLVLSVV
ncbi:unnamed protein product [Rangifer tarandus platyrhynchus]|uniref:Uncharacterized protein n=1 Tax=Rangifer tarandus platyrhynchus TaxID=3082113 RepID=A0ABN8YCS1_RANTA|nr:unnamed protein product [Rangifer tarandus platyrhynchus]